MKKRLLSWLLVLTMVISLVPSTLVTALAADVPSPQSTSLVGKTVEYLTNEWPKALEKDVTDVTITNQITPGATLTVRSGKTLIFHGNGYLSGSVVKGTLIVVEDGGHLVLDDILIQQNKVSENGAIYVKSGGLLDLGYNDQKERRTPRIAENTYADTQDKRNLVIEDGATVRVNNKPEKDIGISYAGMVSAPVPLLEGGRYALTDDDTQHIVADDTKLGTTLKLDTILLRYAKPQFLFLDTTVWMDIAAGGNIGYSILNDWQASDFEQAGAEVTKHASKDSGVTPTYLTDSAVGDIMKYDVIMLCAFYRNPYTGAYNDGKKHDLNDNEYQLLEKFINNGGRVILQCEDANPGNYFNTYINPVGSKIAQRLGAGFNITYLPGGNVVDIPDTTDMNVLEVHPLTDNVSKWRLGLASPIELLPGTKSRTLFNAKGTDGKYWSFAEDMQAGVRDDGQKWGNIMALSDANFWTQSGHNVHYGNIPGAITFAKNILGDSRSNRVYAALGYNPNDLQIDKQASTTTTTTTTTEYETVSKALGKVRDGEYTTLLRDNTLSPVSNELFFQESTLKYADGTKYAGNELWAATAGTYVDITDDGTINVLSGSIKVTPKDANYVLTVNGTMNRAGTSVSGGYQIKSADEYTVIVDDSTSPIATENGGTTSIKATKAGQVILVKEPDGTDVTYTAKDAGEVIYLGKYKVTNNVPNTTTPTSNTPAYYGHDYVAVYKANAGFEMNGEYFKVSLYEKGADGQYRDVEYTLKKSDALSEAGKKTVYASSQVVPDGSPKITVEQAHSQTGNIDRNGDTTVTVRYVTADITIYTTGSPTVSADPNIYVVGVGVNKAGNLEQLWAYPTQRSTKDGQQIKPVEGWPWAKYKIASVGSAKGDEATYKSALADGTLMKVVKGDFSDTFNGWTKSKALTDDGSIKFNVDLYQGDQVVVFFYDWNMVDVKVKARLGTADDSEEFPNYSEQTVELQRDVSSTVLAPTIAGYAPDRTSEVVTPTKDTTGQYQPSEITFYYTLAMSTVKYRAVDESGNELGTWEGPRVIKGDAVSTADNLAPSVSGYEVVAGSGQAVAANNGATDKFDGVNDITVTWTYRPHTRTITIRMVEYDATAPDHIGAELRTDTKTYANWPIGSTLVVTAPAIAGYNVKTNDDPNDTALKAEKSLFVSETGTDEIVFFYEQDVDNAASITVQLWDTKNNKEIFSYKVSAIKGEKQLIGVPERKGYVSAADNKAVSLAPEDDLGNGAGVVRFNYVPDTVKVTIKLVDSSKKPAEADYDLSNKAPNYTFEYDVTKGESIKVTAPDIYGYTLADGQKQVREITVAESETKTEIVQTIQYVPISQEMVYVHVKGQNADGSATYFEYTNSVTQGTASVDVTAFAVSGQKLTAATVDNDNKFSKVIDGVLAVDTSKAAKGSQIEVVFTYGDNTADVTINAYYKGTTNTVEGFTPFTVKAEIGKPYSYGTLSLTGYDNDGAAPSIANVKAQDNVLNYYFTKRTGNVVYQLVEEGNPTHILATKSESVAKDVAIDAAAANAPTATNWKLKDANAAGKITDSTGAEVTAYDGVHAVTVTYKAVAKTKVVTIVRYDVDTNQPIPLTTEEKNAGKTLDATLATGKMHTLPKADYLPTDYTISGKDSVEVYVEDDAEARTVSMYFRRSTDEDVTVVLYYNEGSTEHEIQRYVVQRKPGTTIKVTAPDMAYKGYTRTVKSKDVGPTDNEVKFEYTVQYNTVEIELLDEHGAKLTTPNGYELTRKVRKGEGIVLTAPSIADYTLTSTLVVSKTAKELEQAANPTITFNYKNTAASNYVTHTIKLIDADKTAPDNLITQYSSVVVKSDTAKTTYLAPLQDGYQVDKKSQQISNAASQDVVFNYTKSAATVTIKFVDEKGNPLANQQEQILTGYEKGQTIMVPAPIVPGYALAGQWKNNALEPMTGVTATLALSSKDASNEITFAYETRANVTFVLKDDKGNDIQVINGKVNEEYSVADGEKLNLTASGWKFNASNKDNSPEFNNDNASVTVNADAGNKHYTLHYTRITRGVTYKYWDVTNGENSKTEISFTSNGNPTTVNVGENFTAAAPQIAGYTANALRVVTFVMYDANNANVEVNFNYIRKATGSVTVEHIVKNGSEEKVITSYTASGSVGEWFTATALTTDGNGITTDGKYKFTESDTNKKTQTVKVGADAQTIKFVYEPNYVTVKTSTSVGGTKTEYQTGIEVVKTTGSQKLYAPSMTGYVLKGIEVKQGSNTDGGAKAFPATGWNNNVLTLTGLTNDVEVVYYYEKINDNIQEYQATVTVKDQYASYTLGDWTETVTKDVNSTITPKPHDGYILSGYQIGDSADTKQSIKKDQAATFVLTHKFTADTNVTFFYDRADGSAVVPGEDTKFGTKDDVIIKPNGDSLPKVNADKSVNVPNGAEVVTPNGTVIPPDGSIVKPDGTIVAPDANGKTDPGVTIDPSNPDSSNASYLYVKYLANGGKGEVPTQFFKKGTEITLATNNLTADNKTADGWNTQENGKGTDYANGKTLTPTESMTLYAKWSTSAYTHKVTITFNANTAGANSATKTQVIGSYTSTAFGGTLDANTFTLDGWTFRGWNTEQNGSGKAYTNEQEVTFTSASGATLTLYAQWYRFNADGSITIPGGDSIPNTNKDVTIHPNGNDKPSIDDKGNVNVPNGAEVTTPNGTIIPPNGSTVKPDGTIVTPDNTEITDPTNPPAGYITLTYKYGRTDKQVADVVQYGKDTITVMTGNPFDAPSGYQFDGWKVEGSNDKFTGTTVNATTTLVAQWKLAGSVVLAPDKTTDSGKRLETGAKAGELKLVMRGDWAKDKTLTLGALVDGKQSTNEVYWRVDADSYKNEFGFTNSVLTGDQIVSVDANTGKLTVLNSGIVRVWCISKVNPDIKFSVVVVVPGDVNKDGRVNLNDVDMLCDLSDKLSSITAENPDDMTTWYLKELADMDRNGEFNTNDVDTLCDLADRLNKI